MPYPLMVEYVLELQASTSVNPAPVAEALREAVKVQVDRRDWK